MKERLNEDTTLGEKVPTSVVDWKTLLARKFS